MRNRNEQSSTENANACSSSSAVPGWPVQTSYTAGIDFDRIRASYEDTIARHVENVKALESDLRSREFVIQRLESENETLRDSHRANALQLALDHGFDGYKARAEAYLTFLTGAPEPELKA